MTAWGSEDDRAGKKLHDSEISRRRGVDNFGEVAAVPVVAGVKLGDERASCRRSNFGARRASPHAKPGICKPAFGACNDNAGGGINRRQSS